MEKNYKIGDKTFVLDQTKAEEAFNSKKIINGKDTMFFNILPLKYQWAYDLYKTMKNNHWEPEDIPMQKDVELWRSADLSDAERWIIKMASPCFQSSDTPMKRPSLSSKSASATPRKQLSFCCVTGPVFSANRAVLPI